VNPAFQDVATLLRLRDLVAASDPDGTPSALIVRAPADANPRRLAFLAGSFNPPHAAHLALLDSAERTVELDATLLVHSARTVDKERLSGLCLVDRLLLLTLLVESTPSRGVALINRGLYADQADALLTAWPSLESLYVIVGYDKLVQILDPRYYDDRDAALDRLFGRATLLVAPRADSTAEDVVRLMGAPEHRRYRERVRLLPLNKPYSEMSSSSARARLESGAATGQDLPEIVRSFIAETGAFEQPAPEPGDEGAGRYARRVAGLQALGLA
jgi:nicotinic acid mononucleotide adenylyltransferase